MYNVSALKLSRFDDALAIYKFIEENEPNNIVILIPQLSFKISLIDFSILKTFAGSQKAKSCYTQREE